MDIEKNQVPICFLSINIYIIRYIINRIYKIKGCIFNSVNSKHIFNEEDHPNFFKNKYSLIKGFTDKILSLQKDKILLLRLRQCINNDSDPRNFLNKFMKFETVSDVPNSFTIVPSIFPVITKLIIHSETGIFNAYRHHILLYFFLIHQKFFYLCYHMFVLDFYLNPKIK